MNMQEPVKITKEADKVTQKAGKSHEADKITKEVDRITRKAGKSQEVDMPDGVTQNADKLHVADEKTKVADKSKEEDQNNKVADRDTQEVDKITKEADRVTQETVKSQEADKITQEPDKPVGKKLEDPKTLKLTKKEIDTSMAKDFIKKNRDVLVWPDSDQLFIMQEPDKKGKCMVDSDLVDFFTKSVIKRPHDLQPLTLSKNVADKIEQNTEMFVQLEYLARGTDVRDVKEGHIKLISDIMSCNDALWFPQDTYRAFLINETTPLYFLGIAAALSIYNDFNSTYGSVLLVEKESMLPLCKFFLQICHEVGFEISLLYGDKIAGVVDRRLYTIVQLGDHGCTGIITECGDMESAIDMFVDSSITAPWRLKHVFVQESAFEEFKSILAAKERLSGKPVVCGRFELGNKTFLVECVAPVTISKDSKSIHVQAYRTNKELLTLLEFPYFSIWATNASVSYEIALNSTVPHTVWMNDYGTFDGPPRSALTVLSQFNQCKLECPKLNEILDNWVKLKANMRLDIILAAVEATEDQSIKDLLPELRTVRTGGLIHINDSSIFFGLQKQMSIILGACISTKQDLLFVLKSLVYGNLFLVLPIHYGSFIDELEKLNVPIKKKNVEEVMIPVNIPLVIEQIKIIRSNYGTIYGN